MWWMMWCDQVWYGGQRKDIPFAHAYAYLRSMSTVLLLHSMHTTSTLCLSRMEIW